jgi:hypothetical protein
LVVVHDLKGVAPAPHEQIAGLPWQLAQDLLQVLPIIKTYDYTPDEGLIVYVTTNNWPVYLGHEGDAGAKVALMQAVVEQLTAKGVNVEHIDLRNERRPTYKKR